MSRVAPHNAIIQFVDRGGERIVIKQYRLGAKYSAEQEVQAYYKLDKLLGQNHGSRVAQLYHFDEKNNEIHLEYIPGKNMYEKIKDGDYTCLKNNKAMLVKLFSVARKERIKFDSDPSNIMFDRKGMVFIDPVCKELEIDDYPFIVFMWGLIKVILRNPRVWYIFRIMEQWREYYFDYCQDNHIDHRTVNKQMCEYIELVIDWNREKNSVEGIFVYVFRRTVVIPLYSVVEQLFRWNIVK